MLMHPRLITRSPLAPLLDLIIRQLPAHSRHVGLQQ
jgi:hypothetical protein